MEKIEITAEDFGLPEYDSYMVNDCIKFNSSPYFTTTFIESNTTTNTNGQFIYYFATPTSNYEILWQDVNWSR